MHSSTSFIWRRYILIDEDAMVCSDDSISKAPMAAQSTINADHAIALNKLDLERGPGGFPYQESGLLDPSSSQGLVVSGRDSARSISVPVAADTHRNWSFASSTSTLPVKDQQQNALPAKRYLRVLRYIRHEMLTVYRRLSVLAISANIAVVTLFAVQHKLDQLNLAHIESAVAANLTASILIRQDLVINFLFSLIARCPTWMPLRIRCSMAKIYHLGGLHAGASISAIIWYGVFNRRIANSFFFGHGMDLVTLPLLIITLTLDVLLLTIIALSHPLLRHRAHDAWEAIHRYAGWTAVGLFWAHFFISLSTQLQQAQSGTIGKSMCRSPVFWCLFAITASLILPWLRLQKVPVRVEELSDHAVRLHFGYTNVPLCTAPRFAKNPFRDWHAFAAIPEVDGHGFSILVSNAGDWTSKVIQNPPSELWTKGWPIRGFLHVAPIFKKTLLVATGSGIGPVLSLVHDKTLSVRILWSTRDPLSNYKAGIVEQVMAADHHAMIINTTQHGWPDLVREAYKLYERFEAEAVFVISNPKTTKKTVYGLESRGVPTFAPVFDS